MFKKNKNTINVVDQPRRIVWPDSQSHESKVANESFFLLISDLKLHTDTENDALRGFARFSYRPPKPKQV